MKINHKGFKITIERRPIDRDKIVIISRQLSAIKLDARKLGKSRFDYLREAHVNYVRQLKRQLSNLQTPVYDVIVKHNDFKVENLTVNKIDSRELKANIHYWIEKIKVNRQHRRQPNQSRFSFGHSYYTKQGSRQLGFVHINSGDITRIVQERKVTKFLNGKGPVDDSHHVGVEIECFLKADDRLLVATALHDVNPELVNHVSVGGDGSLRLGNLSSDYRGYEVRIVSSESLIEQHVNEVLLALSRFDVTVNGSCGLHVHIDARNRDKHAVFNRLAKFQAILYRMQPKSRRTSTWCNRGALTYNDARANGSRYQGINPHSYYRHKTIEVRLHSGTVNAVKINNWIKLLVKIVNCPDSSLNFQRCPRSLDRFADLVQLDYRLKRYVKNRVERFAA